MCDLEHAVEVEHGVEVFAGAEVFQFVAGFLFLEALVFNGPAGASSLGDGNDVLSVNGKVGEVGKRRGLVADGFLAHEEIERDALVFQAVDPCTDPLDAMPVTPKA